MAVFYFSPHRFSSRSGWFLFFHPTKTGNFPAASAGWFLIPPHAAHIFSAEASFGISDSISLLVRFCRRKQQKPAIRPLRTAGIALLIFLIVLRQNALDLLLGLHDLVVKALCRHAHRAVPENDQLL